MVREEENLVGFLDKFKKPAEDATGWVCPKCGKVLAPFIIYCPFCTNSAEAENKPLESEEMKRNYADASTILNEWLNGEGGGK